MTVAVVETLAVDEARQRALEVVPRAVRAQMAAHGVTGMRLANVLHISQPQFSARLNGRVPFSADEVAGLAAFFVVPAGVLYADPRETLKTRSDKSGRVLSLASSRERPDQRFKDHGSPLLRST